MASVAKRIMRRVAAHGKSRWVCTPKDFLDFGSRAAVDAALSRLVKAGKLRRVSRGLYDLPHFNSLLQEYNVAGREEVVKAVVRRNGLRILPDGLVAANGLGVTNAVPAKVTYTTDGPSRTIKAGNWKLRFQHAGPKLMQWAGRPGAPVVQALRWLGPYASQDPKVVPILRRRLSDRTKSDLLRNLHDLPRWVQALVRDITAATGDDT